MENSQKTSTAKVSFHRIASCWSVSCNLPEYELHHGNFLGRFSADTLDTTSLGNAKNNIWLNYSQSNKKKITGFQMEEETST